MNKIKEALISINAKFPLVKVLFCAVVALVAFVTYGLIDLVTFEPDFLILYGLEDASKVRARVEEQLRRYRPGEVPPPAPPTQMASEVRMLQAHNPFLPAGVIEQTGDVGREDKFTDVNGIDLIGTVYSYTPERRTALIEMNGIALVVVEGQKIRGSQKKVVEIGRSKISVQEEGLMASPVYLPSEHGLEDLKNSLATNQYKTESNWQYTNRGGHTAKKADEGEAGSAEKGDEAGKAEGEKADGGKADGGEKVEEKKSDAPKDATAEEEETDEDAEPAKEKPARPVPGGGEE